VKNIKATNNLAACEAPTTEFIKKLSNRFLPPKQQPTKVGGPKVK
jgi:hypothetical protein